MICRDFNITRKISTAVLRTICSFAVVAALLIACVEDARAQTDEETTYRDLRLQYFTDYYPLAASDEGTTVGVALMEYSLDSVRCAVLFNHDDRYGYFTDHVSSFHEVNEQDSLYADYLKLYKWIDKNSYLFESKMIFRRASSMRGAKKIKLFVKTEDGVNALYLIDANNYAEIVKSDMSVSMLNIISAINQRQVLLREVISIEDETDN